MPIAHSDLPTLDAHLSTLGVKRGMRIVVHSSLISFGRINGGEAAVYDALRRAVGDEGTIAVPTYTFHLGPDDVFDPTTTPSRGFGALSEWVRRLPAARRGRCPIHGYAAVGPASDLVADADETKSLGTGSSFDATYRAGFHLLLLGCSFQQGATFAHHVEALVGVPYREWLKLPRQIREADGDVREITVDYYGRMQCTPWQPSLHALQGTMMTLGLAQEAPAHYGRSYFMALDDLHRTTSALLTEDPLALVNDATD